MHYSALFLCTFSVFHCDNLYFFILHFFHIAPFPCCTFLCSNLFMLHFFCVALFLCIALFHIAILHVEMFSFSILLLLRPLHVAIFSCCTLFMLYFFYRYSQPPSTSMIESFAATITKSFKYCCKTLHLRCLLGLHFAATISMFHFFKLHFFNIEKY